MSETFQAGDASVLKTCCATLYESDWARLLLGESFHPGGLALTERLGELLGLGPGHRVLDVAAGRGASAVFLARRFGCQVVGVDYGVDMVSEAVALAQETGLSDRVRFEQGDAESLRFANETFDAVICECAFCTFPDKPAAAAEFARVIRRGGRVGLSDLTRTGPLPSELETLLAWIACIADARPIGDYVDYFENAGFVADRIEPHNKVLGDMIKDVRTKLMGAELLVKLRKLELPESDFEQVKPLARSAAKAVGRGQLGYALVIATRF
jgi:ubiquinone/menaquinone biosynthesis C-methylase UbiE